MREHLETRLLDALPPVYRRVRRDAAKRLTARLAARRDPTLDDSFFAATHGVLQDLAEQTARLDSEVERLLQKHGAAKNERERRQVLLQHLEQTVPNVFARRKDRKALGRWLDVDALKERLIRKRHALAIEEELALKALVGVLPSEGNLTLTPAVAELVPQLVSLALSATRLQNQLAAIEAIGALVRAAPLLASVASPAMAVLNDLLARPSLPPQLEAEAWRVMVLLDRELGLGRLRLRFRPPERARGDLLFRRHALERVATILPTRARLDWLTELSASEPSEFVRLGLAELAALSSDGEPLLRKLSGLDAAERSERVRGAAVLAFVHAPWVTLGKAASFLAECLRKDDASLVLRIACEQALKLCSRGGWQSSEEEHSLLRSLEALVARPDIAAPLAEVASSARLAIRCAVDPARREWARFLLRTVLQTKVGESSQIRLDRLPLGLPPLPEEPAWLGELAALLSDRGFGVYLTRSERTLTLWRGDRFQRRLWRTLHEVRNPAPNKRQAFFHTVGRHFGTDLRAHPGQLDEVTATQVPGERVHVSSQGSWGRHLPMVDDVLDLPLGSAKPVRIFSTHGETRIQPPKGFGQRVKNRLRVSRDYAQLASLRLDALHGREVHERRKFVETLERDLGVTIEFAPYDENASVPEHVKSLFPTGRSGAVAGVFGAGPELWTALSDRLVDQQGYFLDPNGNGVMALGLFTAGLFTVFLGDAYQKRQSVRRAREQIPLCIGGWGTRGKSGTERLKAALFEGLGFDVLAKTTGSEAMFVQTGKGSPSAEFFIFRPYDKATIWEQKDLVSLAAKLGTEVFLWECMALQPQFVDLLQNDWMHDDFSTLTNAYPDHEDIQGPAGADVASVITRFMPNGGSVITTEDSFLPLFEEAAKSRETNLSHSPWWEAELIPDDLLELFPYREHPRNVALVAKLAEQLGIPATVAIGYMAEHVQPEIGVLKAFPAACVRGRKLTFINGHSANERTGFLNNWKRSGLEHVDPETTPERAVLTVINNRWDRVARSQVFARILVEDAAADRHVLIGTNLEGLQKYIRGALEDYLERTVVVTEADFKAPRDDRWAPLQRLSRQFAHLRIPAPRPQQFFDRVAVYARGAGAAFESSPELMPLVEGALSGEAFSGSLEQLRERLDREVGPALENCLVGQDGRRESPLPEVLEPATFAEVRSHAIELLARLARHAELRRALAAVEGSQSIASFHQRFRAVYTELFLSKLVPVPDAHATGDQIVEACAKAVGPGLDVSIMGAQNIKGTGLDWVYRWIALEKIEGALAGVRSASPDVRRRAFELLESFEDHGIVDAGLARAKLPELIAGAETPEEAARLGRISRRISERHSAKLKALAHTAEAGVLERVGRVVESGLDYLDSITRRRMSEVLLEDFVEGRISRARAALEMRKLYERQKGGWLVGKLRKPATAEVPVVPEVSRPEPGTLPFGSQRVAIPEDGRANAGNRLETPRPASEERADV